MIDSGKFSKEATANKLKDIEADSIPADLQDAYFNMMKLAMKARVQRDPNFSSVGN